MREYKYEVPIYRHNSPRVFKMSCRAVEQAFPGIKKEDLLIDVDGSTIQVYSIGGREIVLYDDYDVGAVFALSDVDLSPIFRTKF